MIKLSSLNRKTKRVITAIGLVLIIVASFLGGFFTRYYTLSSKTRSLSWIINLIDSNYCYFDEKTGEYKTFTTEDYAKAIADGLLDDYSTYYTSEEYKEEVSTREGNRYGIGVAFYKDGDSAEIVRVTYNSPAERVGIKEGEIITRLVYGENDFKILGYQNFSEVLKSIPPEDEFTLYTKDSSGAEEKSYTLKKEIFVSSYVKYADSTKGYSFLSTGGAKPVGTETLEADASLGDTTAIIKLTSFEGDVAQQLKSALEFMQKRGRTKLILDLRDNGGGLLSILVKVCSLLIETDGNAPFPVAYSIDKSGNTYTYNAPTHSFYDNVEEISVVANGRTASASECLIGAMVHYSYRFSINNLVIEKTDAKTTTFGKGIAQTTYYNYGTGEAMKLTSDFMYWPDKTTCIHGTGISADATNTVDEGLGILRAIELFN